MYEEVQTAALELKKGDQQITMSVSCRDLFNERGSSWVRTQRSSSSTVFIG